MHEMSQDYTDEAGKVKSSNPFIEEPNQSNTVVDMKGESSRESTPLMTSLKSPEFIDVMVLNDIIEQAAGRHSRASDHGGKIDEHLLILYLLLNN